MLSVHLAIWILWCLQLLTLAIRLADTSRRLAVILVITLVFDTLHSFTISIIILAAEARPPPCATTGTLVMPCQCITTSELPSTLVTFVWPFTSM